MTSSPDFHLDPVRDLLLTRDVGVPPDAIWRCWTTPERLLPWFCPQPWRAVRCDIDLRPGGRFRTRLEGPAGESHEVTGCYLEVDPALHRLVFTTALEPGFRPAPRPAGAPPFTGTIVLAPLPDGGTRYSAIARHANAEDARTHADMGFAQGWGIALDQMVAFIRSGA